MSKCFTEGDGAILHHVSFEGQNLKASFSKELNRVKEDRELYNVLLGFV